MTIAAIGNSILTARLLGAVGKGQYTLLYSTVALIIATLALKLDFSQVYFRKEMSFSEMVANTIVLSLIGGLLAVAVAIPLTYFAHDSVYKEIPLSYVWFMLLLVPVLLLAENLRAAMLADYDVPRATVVQSSRPVLFFVLFAVAVSLGMASIEIAMLCIAASILGMLILASYCVLGKARFSGSNVSKSVSNKMLSFGLKTHVGNFFKYLQYRFDIFLVAYFLSAAEVGVYSVAIAVAEMLWKIPNVAGSVLLARLAKASERQAIQLTVRLNRVIFAVTFAGLVLLVWLTPWIIQVAFGPEFAGAAKAVFWLLPGILALSTWKILHTNLIVRGRPNTYSFSVFLAVAIMILGDVILIPSYGVIGAAIASSVAYTVAAMFVLIVVVRANALPVRDYFNFYPELKVAVNTIFGRGPAASRSAD